MQALALAVARRRALSIVSREPGCLPPIKRDNLTHFSTNAEVIGDLLQRPAPRILTAGDEKARAPEIGRLQARLEGSTFFIDFGCRLISWDSAAEDRMTPRPSLLLILEGKSKRGSLCIAADEARSTIQPREEAMKCVAQYADAGMTHRRIALRYPRRLAKSFLRPRPCVSRQGWLLVAGRS